MINLVFPFAPVAKERPRFSSRGGFVRAITAAKTRRFESDVRLWASKTVKAPIEGPLKVTARFFLARPKKLKKGSNGQPITRPDTDNYLKSILDGLNGVVWSDDSQVVHIDAQKLYAMDNAGPRISILVEKAV